MSFPIGDTSGSPIDPPGDDDASRASFLNETPWLGGRVLVAKDNESIRKFLAYRLEKSGTEVSVAEDREEAVELALKSRDECRPFDWVLMDLQMPKLDGFEAARQLRLNGYRGPIIALWAYAIAEHRDESLRFGRDDHLSKPAVWPELVAVLNRLRGTIHTEALSTRSRCRCPVFMNPE